MRGRIRSVKPEIFADEKLWDLGQETGLPILQGFEGLWCFADREGRFEWRPRALKSLILPFWDGDFSRVLDALTTRGFVRQYRVGGGLYGVVTNFHKHQTPNNRENVSLIPEPSEDSWTSTRASRVADASSTPDVSPLDQKKSSGIGILGSGSWDRDLGEGLSGGADAPVPGGTPPVLELVSSDPSEETPAKPPRGPSAAEKAKQALRAAVTRLSASYGHEVAPTASKAHWATGAGKVAALAASGSDIEQAAERVAVAALDRLKTGRSTTFGYALQDCVIGAAAVAVPARPGRLAPAKANTAEDFEGDEDIEDVVARWNK